MPKQVVFLKDTIIEAAYEVFRDTGLNAVSARGLAEKLSCSTAPIYTSFANMDALKIELLGKAVSSLMHYTEQQYTPYIFLNVGIGLLEFAKANKLIYRTLFLENNNYQHILKQFTDRNLQLMKRDQSLKMFTEGDLEYILEKLTVYTHGLAALICADMLEDTSRESLTHNLQQVGSDIMGATAHRRGKLQDYLDCTEDGGN